LKNFDGFIKIVLELTLKLGKLSYKVFITKIMIFFKNPQELFKEIEIGTGLRSNENFSKKK
jgi:hypothetical protein